MKLLVKKSTFILLILFIESIIVNGKNDNSKNNQINAIPKDFFQFFTDLEDINLADNELRKFENGTFSNLKQLKSMNISNNELSELSFDLFNDLSLLKYINLENNKLTSLPSGIFAKNNQLETIILSRNYFQTLPDDLLKNKTKLKTINIEYLVKLTNLTSGFFSNLPNLVSVFVNNCKLENLPENLFHGSNNLRTIRMDNNSLQSLPEYLFHGLINLEELNLERNRIESLPDNIFSSCRKLEKLEISNNNIVRISRSSFNGLHSLRKLFIQYNNIISIDEEKFAILRNISYINLSHNNIKHISKTKSKSGSKLSFWNCKNLNELDLSHNQISNFRQEWTRIPQIQRLNLSNNVLSSITTDDLDLQHNSSYSLDVSYNKIKRIHFNNCETRFLDKSEGNITLFLNDNPIKCDDSLYDLLQYLDGTMTAKVREKLFIEIGQMKCPELVNEYSGTLLSKINSKDYISIPFREGIVNYELCPSECDLRRKRSEQTFIIDCSFRNFTELPEALCYSREDSDYNKLNLTGNFINDVSNITTIGFDKVEILDLSYNQITSLTQTIFLQNKYKMLRLNNNQLKTISLEVKELIYLSVDKIKFGNNSWVCDCETTHLLELIRLHLIEDTDNLICLNSNLQIKTLSFQELCPMNVDVLITLIGIVVGVIGLVLGAIIILYQRYRKRMKIWLYTHSLCLSLITEQDLDKDKIYDAFISYSHKDEEFVINEIIANLESGPRPYKLCIHFRDWLAGVWIPTQIARSIQKSRRTIVVVSPNFINSEWGRVEFRAAYKKGLSEGISRVIVVLYGNIGPIDHLEPDLKKYLKTNTYVQWGDPWFWDKLRYALPHGHGLPNGASNSSDRPHPTAQLEFNKIESNNCNDIELITMEQEIETNNTPEEEN